MMLIHIKKKANAGGGGEPPVDPPVTTLRFESVGNKIETEGFGITVGIDKITITDAKGKIFSANGYKITWS